MDWEGLRGYVLSPLLFDRGTQFLLVPIVPKGDTEDSEKNFSLSTKRQILTFKNIVLMAKKVNCETRSQVGPLCSRGLALSIPGCVQPQGSVLEVRC